MNLRKLIFVNNACYKAGKTITPKGIMVHSTGANNPWLKRYVAPDDGLLGRNRYNNHWNQDKPGGRDVCVHAFIGKLADGSIAAYQTLPWNHRGWHAGGSANNTHISFEICEDDLTDAAYFSAVYKEAVELCVYLCREYGLDPVADGVIIGHYEGYRRGIASNHGDPNNWFPKHGKSMDTFRADVRALLAADTRTESVVTHPEKLTSGYYRVRKAWRDRKSQVGAYRVLANAKAAADKNPGTYVFTNDGAAIYPPDTTAGAGRVSYRVHTVAKGDTLWNIAKLYLGKGSRYPEIKALNGLTSSIIRIGWKLKIPD